MYLTILSLTCIVLKYQLTEDNLLAWEYKHYLLHCFLRNDILNIRELGYKQIIKCENFV